MTDDLFNYFGGSSKRPDEEPLNEDEAAEFEASLEAEREGKKTLEGSEADSAESPSADNENEESEERRPETDPSPGEDSHWDSLADTLGVEPIAEVAKESEAPSQYKSELSAFEAPQPTVEDSVPLPPVAMSDDEDDPIGKAVAAGVSSLFQYDEDDEKESDPQKQVLSEMFVPDPQFEKSLPPEEDDSDSLEGDDDFIEFEVEDLEKGERDRERPPRRRRSRAEREADGDTLRQREPRRKEGRGKESRGKDGRGRSEKRRGENRGEEKRRDEKRSDEKYKEAKRGEKKNETSRKERKPEPIAEADDDGFAVGLFEDASPQDPPSEETETRSRSRRRRRSRRGEKNRDSSADATEAKKSRKPRKDRDEASDEEGGQESVVKSDSESDRGERRGKRRRRSRGAREESDSGENKKTPKFPTWLEAISDIVDSNLANRRKPSGRRRGGRNR